MKLKHFRGEMLFNWCQRECDIDFVDSVKNKIQLVILSEEKIPIVARVWIGSFLMHTIRQKTNRYHHMFRKEDNDCLSWLFAYLVHEIEKDTDQGTKWKISEPFSFQLSTMFRVTDNWVELRVWDCPKTMGVSNMVLVGRDWWPWLQSAPKSWGVQK